MTALDAILNHVELTDDIGTSGQPTTDQFTDIRAAGYEVVVNLATPMSENALADEGAIVADLGMSYVNIPVDFADPTEADYAAFRGVMAAFEGRAIWVHCAMNLRVSAFCHRWLTETRDAETAEATRPILDAWRPRMEPVWRAFLERDAS